MNETWLAGLMGLLGGAGWIVAAYWFCRYCEAIQTMREQNQKLVALDQELRSRLLNRDQTPALCECREHQGAKLAGDRG